jgi:hypothetical protein
MLSIYPPCPQKRRASAIKFLKDMEPNLAHLSKTCANSSSVNYRPSPCSSRGPFIKNSFPTAIPMALLFAFGVRATWLSDQLHCLPAITLSNWLLMGANVYCCSSHIQIPGNNIEHLTRIQLEAWWHSLVVAIDQGTFGHSWRIRTWNNDLRGVSIPA